MRIDFESPMGMGMTFENMYGYGYSYTRPASAPHPSLSPTLISFVEREQFGGHPSENPNAYLRKFLVKCDTIKLNGVSIDAIRLQLFHFSLRDKASD